MAAEILPKVDRFARVLPILRWLPGYDACWLRADVIAGLTLWGILVPEGIAYAGLAGAPVRAVLYALLGLSRRRRHPGDNAAGGLGPDLCVLISTTPGRKRSYWSRSSLARSCRTQTSPAAAGRVRREVGYENLLLAPYACGYVHWAD
jgi:hypothetical protein